MKTAYMPIPRMRSECRYVRHSTDGGNFTIALALISRSVSAGRRERGSREENSRALLFRCKVWR
jgi:hypothetical protein